MGTHQFQFASSTYSDWFGLTRTNSSLLQLDYGYGSTNNNGNLQSQTISVAGLTLAQTYTYDELNRLKSATELSNGQPSWKQTYNYDRFGNRTFDGTNNNTTLPVINDQNTNLTNPSISEVNNRISSAGYDHDPAGNLKCDAAHPCVSGTAYFEYNAENLLKTAGGGASSGGASYSYDGDKRRVKKVVGGTSPHTTVFVYDVAGQLVAEYSSAGSSAAGTSYVTADNLGTPRIITNQSGNIVTRHDHLPFGEEIDSAVGQRANIPGYSETDSLRQKFTGKERDPETTLDYFGTRYYSSAQGRFTTPDDFLNDTRTDDTLSWNLYVYVRNNPLKYIDRKGEKVDGTDLTPEQRQQLIDDWKKKTGYKDISFKPNKDGRQILTINVDAGHEGGLKIARTELLEAQNSEKVLNLTDDSGMDTLGAVNAFPKIDRSGGKMVLLFNVRLNFAGVASQEGDADAIEATSIGIVAIHEFEHVLHGAADERTVHDKYINPIRSELKLPESVFGSPYEANGREYTTYIAPDKTKRVASWKKPQKLGAVGKSLASAASNF